MRLSHVDGAVQYDSSQVVLLQEIIKVVIRKIILLG